MKTLINILAVIGGLCVFCVVLFLMVGVVNSIRACRELKEGDEK